ncbi:hypothetical protein M4V62_36680 [Streptomyces durmitorensis]|uniref:Citrate lyase subunit beta / citryl-CoA lyase n=1 Tax=Streptomyces durmitorensis TaxID=319947 RepID=A0ABY4Q4L8_9ACTN|nr:hypothetical protein [Streptomyces durmitorensis]UQT60153.1 hypothetical protein M4V62_36680 [Streptomyces durmitorensis]
MSDRCAPPGIRTSRRRSRPPSTGWAGNSSGFTGKLCVHPAQVSAVADGFTPSERELRWARAVLEAGESVTTVEGQMVDKPVLDRARQVLDGS